MAGTSASSFSETPGKSADDRKEGKQGSYDIHVACLGPGKVANVEITRLDFIIPPGTAPAGLTHRWHVSVDPKDGWPRLAYSFRDYTNIQTQRTLATPDDQRLAPEGYPVGSFPSRPSKAEDDDTT